MTNAITTEGLQTKTLTELVADLQAAYQSIYGADINLGSNSPDGQIINIFAQKIRDVLDLVTQVYAGFDPDQAIGKTLDARCAFNGVKRKAGTYSTTDISVTVNQALNLVGLDDKAEASGEEFVIADNTGNQWILLSSVSVPGAGTYVYVFRSVKLGAVTATPNTITTPVSIVLGVESVNNPTTQLTVGQDEESDADLKIRRLRSVALSSRGFYDALRAALLNINEVTAAEVYENPTGDTDDDDIPPHSIWVIVQGGSDEDVAQVIYAKRNAGAGMKGEVTVTVTRSNGTPFTINFDRVASEDVYIKFQADALSGNISDTGDTHNGTAIIDNLDDTSDMEEGMLVRGAGIPEGAVIVSKDSSSQITLSVNSTGNNTNTAITVVPVNPSDLKAAIAEELVPGIYQALNINALGTLIQGINQNLLITNAGFSLDGVSYVSLLSPSAKNKQFSVTVGKIKVV